MKRRLGLAVFVVALSAGVGVRGAPLAGAGAGTVKSEQKISDTAGAFTGVLDDFDGFGRSVASLGDLNGDGTVDLAVGASEDDDGGDYHGAVWILFLDTDGTVKSEQKISETMGAFGGDLDDDRFGTSVASLGDLDGDGVVDLAVGAITDDDGGDSYGAVWILFLNTDGTVKSQQKISATSGGFAGVIGPFDFFGSAVASLGDLNGDGIGDLAVGEENDDGGGTNKGAVWILFLDTDGTVKSEQKINELSGGFTGTLDVFDRFGASLASLGDLDGDGIGELAVGASHDDDGGSDQGAVWILFLNTDGTVQSQQKISESSGSFTGILDPFDEFGRSVASVGDLDGDGIGDLTVGAYLDDDGGTNKGAVWNLFLRTDGSVKSEQKVSDSKGGFGGILSPDDFFGLSVVSLGDLDGDGTQDLAVGAGGDDDGGSRRGAVWILFLGHSHPPHIKPLGPLPAPTRPSGPPADPHRESGTSVTGLKRPVGDYHLGTLRNGSGRNPIRLVGASEPRAGRGWRALVDVSDYPGATSILLLSDRPLSGAGTAAGTAGELLLDLSGHHLLATSAVRSSSDTHAHAIELEPAHVLAGRRLYAQALILTEGLDLTNAVDLVVGR